MVHLRSASDGHLDGKSKTKTVLIAPLDPRTRAQYTVNLCVRNHFLKRAGTGKKLIQFSDEETLLPACQQFDQGNKFRH